MADWILVPCLHELRREFGVIAPFRDRASDGTIGDQGHAGDISDHNPDETGRVPIRDADRINEVHAFDCDKDLNQSGLDMEAVVQFLLARCRAGTERRLRYIIWNRRIWEASNGWRQRTYTGKNAHDQHAHFSASYDTKHESDTSSWGLEEEFEVIDYEKIRQIVAEEVDARVDKLTQATPLMMADKKTPDGTYSTPVGHWVLSQGIPDRFETDGRRSPFYEVFDKAVAQIIRQGEAIKQGFDNATLR